MKAIAACVLASIIPLGTAAHALEFKTATNGGDCDTCSWIAAEGDITAESTEELERFLSENPSAGPLIAFHSPGGVVLGGLQLGSLIRSRGLWTTIGHTVADGRNSGRQRLDPGVCASSCAYSFLGGVRRFADAGEFGVHQFYSEEDSSKVPPEPQRDKRDQAYQTTESGLSQTFMAAVLVYLIRMDADPEILAIASNMIPETIHFFTAEELVTYGVTTENGAAQDWSLHVAGAGMEARASVDRPWLARTDMRLYCEGERRFFAIDIALHGRPGELVADVAQNAGSLRFRLGDRIVDPGIEDFAYDGERAAMHLLFRVDAGEFERLAGAAEIAADRDNLPPAARNSFELFRARLSGDARAPMLALRNCVG